jgi:glycosyltransferase involved in cell wall biosynthesis
MIVANYNSSDDHGGAAKAAFRLNAALRKADVEAFMLCRHKQTRSKYSIRLTERRSEISPRIARFERFWMQTARQFLVSENRTGLSSTIFSIDPFGLDVTEAPLASVARVHHLHWCHGFISPAVLRCIRVTNRPIFMTLHDQWWMTGGCHYSAGCNKFEEACIQCPQLFSDPADVAQTALAEKVDVFAGSDVTVVAPSQWMADCASRSAVFRNADIRVVRNPVEIETFAPLLPAARAEVREELGLNDGDVAILFGAQTLADRRKGFTELVEALKLVKARSKRRLCLVSFGRSARNALSVVNIPSIELGEISDDTKLARIYAAADIFVIPSLEDNYPNTVVESLACGTPVVGFAAGGISDLVDGSTTGLLADRVGNVADLADAIIVGLDKFVGNFEVREGCRRAVEAPHDPQNIAAHMIGLYSEKAIDFHDALTREEKAIIQATVGRNGTGKSTFARLDASSSIFNSESVMRILLPLSSLHDANEQRCAAIRREADVSIAPGKAYALGRGQEGIRHLGQGWAPPYLNGVWSDAQRAYMHFFVDANETINSIELDLAGHKDMNLTIVAGDGDKEYARLDITGAQPKKFTIPITQFTGPGYFNLTLSVQSEVAGDDNGKQKLPKVFVSVLTAKFEVPVLQSTSKVDHWIDRLLPLRARSRSEIPR